MRISFGSRQPHYPAGGTAFQLDQKQRASGFPEEAVRVIEAAKDSSIAGKLSSLEQISEPEILATVEELRAQIEAAQLGIIALNGELRRRETGYKTS